MASYLIGIGGTGAKCVESVLHLSACGLLPRRKLYVLFVDPDQSNGNLGRAQYVLDTHAASQSIALGACPLFQTLVERADPATWSPFSSDAGEELTLERTLSYNQIRSEDPALAGLFDVLYSEEEKTAKLHVGFRGRPSIGAAVLAQQLTLDNVEPWKTFKDRIKEDTASGEPARIFLCGSVFGGTGASGIPTIAKLIRSELAKTKNVDFSIGGSLVLPYFSYEGTPEDEDLHARANSFVPNTQSALKYYWKKRHDDVFDRIYVLGDPALSPVGEASVGGPKQKNSPHVLELFVGLAAADFFTGRADQQEVGLVSRESADRLGWDDLPYPTTGEVKQKLNHAVHFAFAYLSTYKPALDALRQNRVKAYRYPWYVDLIERQGVELQEEEVWAGFQAVENYSRSLLEWVAALHASSDTTQVDLFDCRAFARLDTGERPPPLRDRDAFLLERFGVLSDPDHASMSRALSTVWERVSSAARARETERTGIFLRALYNACDPSTL